MTLFVTEEIFAIRVKKLIRFPRSRSLLQEPSGPIIAPVSSSALYLGLVGKLWGGGRKRSGLSAWFLRRATSLGVSARRSRLAEQTCFQLDKKSFLSLSTPLFSPLFSPLSSLFPLSAPPKKKKTDIPSSPLPPLRRGPPPRPPRRHVRSRRRPHRLQVRRRRLCAAGRQGPLRRPRAGAPRRRLRALCRAVGHGHAGARGR